MAITFADHYRLALHQNEYIFIFVYLNTLSIKDCCVSIIHYVGTAD